MRRDALNYIACPNCKNPLIIKDINLEHGTHIISGALNCTYCPDIYSITRGVPRLLSSHVRSQDLGTGQAYSSYFSEIVPEGTLSKGSLYGKTIQEELDDFCLKVGVEDLNSLNGLILLDAGCGMARIEGDLANYCRDVIAFDITPAVDQAFEAWRDISNIHIIQGDLTAIPVLPERFDLVWCDGALPYVSDFSTALTELLRSRTPKGFLYSWVYGPDIPVIERVGRLLHITRLPIKARFFMAQIINLFLLLIGSIIKRKYLLNKLRHYSEGALDFSLAEKVNHVSPTRIRLLLQQNCGIDKVVITTFNRVVKFSVGSLEEMGK